jgi:hypothetical protein
MSKLTCDSCGGGLDGSDLAYGLVCNPCGVRVAGPFEDTGEVPDYESVAEQAARYAHEAIECAEEDRIERHGEDDGLDERGLRH